MNMNNVFFNLRQFFGCGNLWGGVLTVLLAAAGTMQAQNAQKPVIARQPASATYAENATARFYVNAYSTDGGYLTYQWYRSQPFAAPQTNEAVIKAGATPEGTAATLITTTPAVTGTEYYYYWVEITNTKDGLSAVEVSIVAQAKIVDRTLEDHIINGNMEYWRSSPAGYTDSRGNTFLGNYTSWYSSLEGTYDPKSGWRSTQEPTSGYNVPSTWKNGYVEVLLISTSWLSSPNTASNGYYMVELGAISPSSIYQDIATVPGKIYEWSLDHGARSGVGLPQRIAVVIGNAINSQEDYLPGTTDRYNKKNGAAFHNGFPYGVSSGTQAYTYFNDIVNALAKRDAGGNISSLVDGNHTIDYNGSTYYVAVRSSPTAAQFAHHSGVYSVPVGQGSTVFGFSFVYPLNTSNGNFIDNVVFASGSPLALTPTITYGNDVSISVPTKAGYVYGLAEVRGSTVSLVADATAYYDPDGTGALPEAAIAETAGLGIGGWYSTYGSNTPFTASGVITFKNLVPGNTYRVVGIPLLAVNMELHVNETPAYVLDEGYYKDVQTAPAFEGDATTIWNIEVDTCCWDGAAWKARVSVKNARSDVEYALLAGDATGPVTTASAHVWTDWTAVASGPATFENLDLDAYYYLVARPNGYNETGFADAAYGPDGSPAYIRILTPADTGEDIDVNDVSRDPSNCGNILLSNSKAGYTYAIVDPSTGVIIGATQNGNGSTLTFSVPETSKTYQAVTKKADANANWLRGIRVYGCPDVFSIDFWQETVNSSRDASGYIPPDVEYRLCGLDARQTWIVGGPDAWTAGIGTQPLNLSALTLAGNTRSILDSLQSLDADATLSYRVMAEADYTGPSVGNVRQLVIPRRPYAPVSTDYEFDYEEEEILVRNVDSLQFAPVNTGQWTSILRDASWTFAAAGWGDKVDGGASELPFGVRFGATSTSFASIVRPDTIPPRAAAPAVRLKSNDARDKVVIIDMISGIDYVYRTDVSGYTDWRPYTPGASITESDSIPFTHNNVCYVRYPATSVAPASFSAILVFPIAIQSIHFADLTYGDIPVMENVIVINSTASGIKITGIRLEGVNTEYYTLTGPSAPADSLAPANGVNNKWTLRPINGLSFGVYDTQLKMTYDDNGVTGEKEASVYLRVDKAEWDMSGIQGAFDVAQTRAEQLVLNVSGAPAGAELLYYNGLTPFPGSASSTVDGSGTTTYTFTSAANGLQPATTYAVYAQAGEDTNHYASAIVLLAEGYTAYATPVFGDVITIDYVTERLTFAAGYSPGDYTVTVHCAACTGGGSGSGDTLAGPYVLSALLDDTTNSTLSFSLVRNAGIAPPYPASEAVFSGAIAGRAAAPPVTVVNALSPTSYNGEIHVAGTFEYRIHGTTSWNAAMDAAVNLGAGEYDVRYPAVVGTSFASQQAKATVGVDLHAVDDRVSTVCAALPLVIDVTANDATALCSPVGISIDQLPTAPGSSAVVDNGKILYTAGAQPGFDTIAYSIVCGQDASSAHIYIYVAAKPDNISEADCTVDPLRVDWGIREVLPMNTADQVHNLGSLSVGPLSGNDTTFIIGFLDYHGSDVAAHTYQSHGLKLFYFDKTTQQITWKRTIPFVDRSVPSNPVSFYTSTICSPAIARYNGKGYIVVPRNHATELYLYAFDENGDFIWRSDAHYTGDASYFATIVNIADFNRDGIPEVYAGNRVFSLATGELLCDGGSNNKGVLYKDGGDASFAADVVPGGNLELCAGTQIYSVTIPAGATGATGCSMAVISDMQLTSPPSNAAADGATQAVDLDGDGALEIVVVTQKTKDTGNQPVVVYAWKPLPNNGSYLLGHYTTPHNSDYYSLPMIGNIDRDAYPEIVYIGDPSHMYALDYAPAGTQGDRLRLKWEYGITDESSCTGMSLFDFNNDTISEIVYRDEQKLYIIDGNVTTPESPHTEAHFDNVYSYTLREAPVIADVDADGQAEIVVTGGLTISEKFNGYVRVFKSDGSAWSPARPVWNQYAYNATNINDDLTVPAHPVHPATFFSGHDGVLATADDVQPYNNFRRQHTVLNHNGLPFRPAPDAVFDHTKTTVACDGDSVWVSVCIVNVGDAAIGFPVYFSLYRDYAASRTDAADYTARFVAVDSIVAIIPPDGGTDCLTIGAEASALLPPPPTAATRLVVRLNDREGVYPYQQECDCTDSVEFLINPALDQIMTKRATLNNAPSNGTYGNPASILYRDTLTYEITAVNANVKDAAVVITDTLPAYLTYAANSAKVETGGSGSNSISSGKTPSGTPQLDTVRWEIPNVASYATVRVSFKATPVEGVVASQPLFINKAWATVSDTISVQTNGTYHQGAGVSTVTFSASVGGTIFNADRQALDYRTSPRGGILIVPDSGYIFAGWSHDTYYSLRGELIPSDSGIMNLDTLTIYGNVDLRAEFVPSVAESEKESVVAEEDTVDKVWSHGGILYVRTTKSVTVHVYTPDGVLWRLFAAAGGVTTHRLAPGVYIVTLDGGAGTKVAVSD
jgi:uncharacterized repeat protein (TIGR01451 family)